MHSTHQKYLITSLKSSVVAIETALAEQFEDTRGLPAVVAERKATIIQNLDNVHRFLEQVEPALREQNQ